MQTGPREHGPFMLPEAGRAHPASPENPSDAAVSMEWPLRASCPDGGSSWLTAPIEWEIQLPPFFSPWELWIL